MRRSSIMLPPVFRPPLPFRDGDEPAGIVFLSGSAWFGVNSSEVVQLAAQTSRRRRRTTRALARPAVTWSAPAPDGRQ